MTRRVVITTTALAGAVCALIGLRPAGADGSGAGACLRMPGAKVVYNTSEAVIVRVRGRSSHYGCLKQQGKPVRIDRRSPKQVFAVYPPAGRYVVTLSYGGVKKLPMRVSERLWVILTDLRTGAEYRVFKGFLREGCCGSISNVIVRDTGSVIFLTSYAKPNLQFYLYACELSTCYDQRRYGRRLRVLDRGPNGVYNVRFDGETVRWTDADDGQDKAAALE